VNYLDFDLGQLTGGETVLVELSGVESDVLLVTPTELSNLSAGRTYRYWGGHYKRSPARIGVPSGGHWHVVVVPGLGGRVTANVSVLPASRAVGF
jgi:Domain of unknown function (DUF1883)